MAVVVHDDGDEAFLVWMQEHPNGFVLNVRKVDGERSATLHRSGCAHIRVLRHVSINGGFTRGGLLKICGETRQELFQYLASNRLGATLKVIRCRSCGPSPSDITLDRLAEEVPPTWYSSNHVIPVLVNAYEQDALSKLHCLQAHGTVCKVCSLDLERLYGKLGIAAIHVHFLPTKSGMHDGFTLDPVRDLVPVCPTCHAMLHRGRDEPLRIEDLKQIMDMARVRWHERSMREY